MSPSVSMPLPLSNLKHLRIFSTMMKLFVTIFLSLACFSAAFQVQPRAAAVAAPRLVVVPTTSGGETSTSLYGFLPEPERESLTRDSEPDDFFATYVPYNSLVAGGFCGEIVVVAAAAFAASSIVPRTGVFLTQSIIMFFLSFLCCRLVDTTETRTR